MRLDLTSTAFADGAPIPTVYTCEGRDVSPPLAWSGVPAGVTELQLRMEDPDAPGGTFVHWVVSGIEPGTTSLPEGSAGYKGPCPPGGKTHHYVLTLRALEGDRVVGQGRLVGTYER